MSFAPEHAINAQEFTLTPSSTMVDKVERKIDELRTTVVAELTAVMKKSKERVMQKIDELAAETANLKMSLAEIEKRVTKVEMKCADVLTLRSELVAAQVQLRELESIEVATDAIINGIPQADNDNLSGVFSKICDAVQHKTPPLRDVFQLRKTKTTAQKNNNHAPITVKLFSAHDRSQLFKVIAAFCKSKKRSLSLADIEQPGYGKINVYESLPTALQEVMSYASELKRNKLLASALFVRLKPKEEPKIVKTRTELNALIEIVNRNCTL